MSTPKTPMERYDIARHKQEGSMWFSQKSLEDGLDWRDHIAEHFYLAGDADRERLMRGEASRGWRAWAIENFNIAPDLVEEFRFEFTCNLDQTLKAWTAARADRQELVACVLEMANVIKAHCGESDYDCYRVFMRASLLKHSDLIAKLKAEKGTL